MIFALCVVIFILGIGIDGSLSNIYKALDKIADELRELRKQLDNK